MAALGQTTNTPTQPSRSPSKRESLNFPQKLATPITPYLPTAHPNRLHLTLTYAQSLDASLSLAPGVRTALSGAETKAMTHYLRAHHASILVGAGTAAADDPALNCRLEGVGLAQQPRPIVLDPRARWEVSQESAVVRLAAAGLGKAPWILCCVEPGEKAREVVEGVGGKYIRVPADADGKVAWEEVLKVLWEEGIESLMVEGGGRVMNDLLALANSGVDVVDSVIVTIAPVWLGAGGVVVAPERNKETASGGPRLESVTWSQMGEDIVLCGRINQ